MSPAGAAQCTATTGVSVVVDFNRGAGNGIETSCAAGGGGKYASAIFPPAGFPLEYVGGGDSVCRVKSAPAGADCSQTAPANAYWGLFWAKRGASRWTYSTAGVAGLRVPDGGAVAWAFQDGGDTDFPGVDPSQRAEPKPTPKPTKAPPKASSGSAGGSGGGGSKPTKAAEPAKGAGPNKAATTATTAAPTPSPSARAAAKDTGEGEGEGRRPARVPVPRRASPSRCRRPRPMTATRRRRREDEW